MGKGGGLSDTAKHLQLIKDQRDFYRNEGILMYLCCPLSSYCHVRCLRVSAFNVANSCTTLAAGRSGGILINALNVQGQRDCYPNEVIC